MNKDTLTWDMTFWSLTIFIKLKFSSISNRNLHCWQNFKCIQAEFFYFVTLRLQLFLICFVTFCLYLSTIHSFIQSDQEYFFLYVLWSMLFCYYFPEKPKNLHFKSEKIEKKGGNGAYFLWKWRGRWRGRRRGRGIHSTSWVEANFTGDNFSEWTIVFKKFINRLFLAAHGLSHEPLNDKLNNVMI